MVDAPEAEILARLEALASAPEDDFHAMLAAAGLDLRTDLPGADLSGLDLSGTDLSGADLTRCALAAARFREARLEKAVLVEADLTAADLTEADLREADLRGADLGGANLRGADLRGAKLLGADLREADLLGADLGGADLGGADLTLARLVDAKLNHADLTGAKLWETQRGDWSITGVICQHAFWDREGREQTSYKKGEFERFFAKKQRNMSGTDTRLMQPSGVINKVRAATGGAAIGGAAATLVVWWLDTNHILSSGPLSFTVTSAITALMSTLAAFGAGYYVRPGVNEVAVLDTSGRLVSAVARAERLT